MKHQSGNVLFLILIAVALFAALSYAVTSSSKGGGNGISKDKAKILASELTQYTTSIEQAINRMQLMNGCSNEQISFENPETSGYTNANAPADKRCHIFDPAGGGLSNNDLHFAEISGDPLMYMQHGNGSGLQDVGVSGCGDATCSDLYTFYNMRGDNMDLVCESINKGMGHADLVPTLTTGYLIHPPKFTGTYTGTHTATGAAFRGKRTFCYNYATDPTRYFYVHVLLAR